jgi:hypothetical protein
METEDSKKSQLERPEAHAANVTSTIGVEASANT